MKSFLFFAYSLSAVFLLAQKPQTIVDTAEPNALYEITFDKVFTQNFTTSSTQKVHAICSHYSILYQLKTEKETSNHEIPFELFAKKSKLLKVENGKNTLKANNVIQGKTIHGAITSDSVFTFDTIHHSVKVNAYVLKDVLEDLKLAFKNEVAALQLNQTFETTENSSQKYLTFPMNITKKTKYTLTNLENGIATVQFEVQNQALDFPKETFDAVHIQSKGSLLYDTKQNMITNYVNQSQTILTYLNDDTLELNSVIKIQKTKKK